MKPLHKIIMVTLLVTQATCVFAEFKVEIKNLNDVVTHGGEFETEELANSWVEENSPSGAWGKLERVIPRSEATNDEINTELLEEIAAEFEGFGEDGLPVQVQPERVRLKKTFSVTISDITSQKIAESKVSEAFAEMQKGANILAKFRAMNKLKSLTKQQKKAIRSNPVVKEIIEALSVGDIEDAKDLVEAFVPDGSLITENDKAIILEEINK
jgi:hypothetical protein